MPLLSEIHPHRYTHAQTHKHTHAHAHTYSNLDSVSEKLLHLLVTFVYKDGCMRDDKEVNE